MLSEVQKNIKCRLFYTPWMLPKAQQDKNWILSFCIFFCLISYRLWKSPQVSQMVTLAERKGGLKTLTSASSRILTQKWNGYQLWVVFHAHKKTYVASYTIIEQKEPQLNRSKIWRKKKILVTKAERLAHSQATSDTHIWVFETGTAIFHPHKLASISVLSALCGSPLLVPLRCYCQKKTLKKPDPPAGWLWDSYAQRYWPSQQNGIMMVS